MRKHVILPVLVLASWWSPTPAEADRLTVTSDRDWNEWSLPGDAVEVSGGRLTPAIVRRDVDAVADAMEFGGGIRDVGSDSRNAVHILDGNLDTHWSPAFTDPVTDWWIEVDLGRVVSARTIRMWFAEEGAALEFFNVLASDGEPFFNVSRTNIEGTVRYNKQFRFSFNDQHFIEIDLDLKPLRYVRIEAKLKTEDVHLSRLEVETVGDNLALHLRDRGGDVSIISKYGAKKGEREESAGLSGVLVDGDLTTTWGLHFTGVENQTFPEEIFGRFWLDLGAVFWVDRVRILGDASGINPGAGTRSRDRAFNFRWYRLSGSDGSVAPNRSLRWTLLGELPPDQKNLKEVVHFEERFELQKLRFFQLIFPMTNQLAEVHGRIGTTAEFQVFGEGHAAEIVGTSPLYDLGGVMHISAIEWSTDTPPGARIEIRSRTGNLLEETHVYHDKDGAEVTKKRYDKLIPSFKGAIDTVKSPGADWSPWSRAYDRSGGMFLSPAPRRFVQLELRMFGVEPSSAATLNSITLNFDEPLAQQTRGEVYPSEAMPGAVTTFTYFLSATILSRNLGFDQVLITSQAAAEYANIRLDGQPIDAVAEHVEEGFLVTLERPLTSSGVLEIDFLSTLYLNQTRFDAFLVTGKGAAAIHQQVDPGDADPLIESDVTAITLPTDQKIIDGLTFASRVFTPNGDGIGDRLLVSFDVFQVNVSSRIEVAVYDLSGRRLRDLSLEDVTAGPMQVEWDGRDASGHLQPPGNYFLRVRFEGDALTETIDHTVLIAY